MSYTVRAHWHFLQGNVFLQNGHVDSLSISIEIGECERGSSDKSTTTITSEDVAVVTRTVQYSKIYEARAWLIERVDFACRDGMIDHEIARKHRAEIYKVSASLLEGVTKLTFNIKDNGESNVSIP